MKFAKLLDAKGRPIERPKAVPGSVSFNAREGVAQAWGADGQTLLAEMVKARVEWIRLAVLVTVSNSAQLLDEVGIGIINAAVVLAAWSHSGRIRSE